MCWLLLVVLINLDKYHCVYLLLFDRNLDQMSIAQGQGATRWAKKAEVRLKFPDAEQWYGDSHMHKGGATTARCTEVVRRLHSDGL